MSTVTLFLPSGKTFTFRGAEIVGDTEAELFLKYVAVSDGRIGEVRIRKDAIVAYSVKSDQAITFSVSS